MIVLADFRVTSVGDNFVGVKLISVGGRHNWIGVVTSRADTMTCTLLEPFNMQICQFSSTLRVCLFR